MSLRHLEDLVMSSHDVTMVTKIQHDRALPICLFLPLSVGPEDQTIRPAIFSIMMEIRTWQVHSILAEGGTHGTRGTSRMAVP
jgi:hypothetical protein